MTINDEHSDWIDDGLEKLYAALVKAVPTNCDRVREYIHVGEFPLALDLLSPIYLKSRTVPSPEDLKLIDALAERMGMQSGDEWRGVAQLRALT